MEIAYSQCTCTTTFYLNIIKCKLITMAGCFWRINLSQNVCMLVENLIWIGWPPPGTTTSMHNIYFSISLATRRYLSWKFKAIIPHNIATFPGPIYEGEERAWYTLLAHAPGAPEKCGAPDTIAYDAYPVYALR